MICIRPALLNGVVRVGRWGYIGVADVRTFACMIPELLIEEALNDIVRYGEAEYEEALLDLQQEQGPAMAYLMSEQFELLSEAEREYMLWLALVVWQSVTKAGEPRMADVAQVEAADEANWETLNAIKAKSFREKLDPFFEQTEQEDLLAFLEDSLTDDGEEGGDAIPVQPESREYVFAAVKTLVDVWTGSRV